MSTWAVAYRPVWGELNRYIVYVKASCYDAAMIKFYSKYDDNCDEILHVERCRG